MTASFTKTPSQERLHFRGPAPKSLGDMAGRVMAVLARGDGSAIPRGEPIPPDPPGRPPRGGTQLGEHRRDLRAGVDGQRAPPAEPAAGSRVDDLGRLAAVGRALSKRER